MSLIDRLLAMVAPHECLGCGAEGALLCAVCAQALPAIPSRCYRCHKVSAEARTCSGCRKTSRLRSVGVATIYEAVAKEIVWKLKFAGAQEAAKVMATRMVPLLEVPLTAVFVPVPTATSRVRRRGYDQAALLARELARQTKRPAAPCLVRTGQQHQVGARRQQRLRQLATAFRAKNSSTVRDGHVILVDDVVTTGATLEAAAAVIMAAGAKRVDAVVFAQP